MSGQAHERIVYEGYDTLMACCPALPYDLNVLFEDETVSRSGNTACYRGYNGDWEIKDDRLYLVSVQGRFHFLSEEPMHATWVTDVIRIVFGKRLVYLHAGFMSVYQQELFLKIVEGDVVGRKFVDNGESQTLESYDALRNLEKSWDEPFVHERPFEEFKLPPPSAW